MFRRANKICLYPQRGNLVAQQEPIWYEQVSFEQPGEYGLAESYIGFEVCDPPTEEELEAGYDADQLSNARESAREVNIERGQQNRERRNRAIRDIVQSAGENGVLARDMYESLQADARGLGSEKTLKRAVSELVENGILRREGSTHQTRIFWND